MRFATRSHIFYVYCRCRCSLLTWSIYIGLAFLFIFSSFDFNGRLFVVWLENWDIFFFNSRKVRENSKTEIARSSIDWREHSQSASQQTFTTNYWNRSPNGIFTSLILELTFNYTKERRRRRRKIWRFICSLQSIESARQRELKRPVHLHMKCAAFIQIPK